MILQRAPDSPASHAIHRRRVAGRGEGAGRGLARAAGGRHGRRGPGFLTQTAVFTDKLHADFAFAILASVLVDLAVQANVWTVLGVARKRGQELASLLLPGLGPALALLVAFGGLAFNVGNVAGCGLGLAVFGLPAPVGAAVSAVGAILLVARPRAGRSIDVFTKALGFLMIAMTAVIMVNLRGLWAGLEGRLRETVAGFVGISLAIYLFVGRPVRLLILAGALNGLILPVTLGVVLLACRRRDLLGDYRHPVLLQAVGWIAWVVSLGAGLLAFEDLIRLFVAR
jgi:Mn2+/Fe2+ NRAMP family transporter